MIYRSLLAIHVIAIISWMAGLLYLFRIFVYYKEYGETSSDNHNLLSLMGLRLYKIITVNAMMVAVSLGLIMSGMNHTLAKQPWFIVKFFAAILLIALTIHGGRIAKKIAKKEKIIISARKFRILNESVTILMIIIVCMVILRPF